MPTHGGERRPNNLRILLLYAFTTTADFTRPQQKSSPNARIGAVFVAHPWLSTPDGRAAATDPNENALVGARAGQGV